MHTPRKSFATAAALLVGLCLSASALAQDTVRIALITKTYWASVTTLAAVEKGAFAREGIKPDYTVYKSGADAYQALAANAADVAVSTAALTAAGTKRGFPAKVVGVGSKAALGWHLVVLKGSKITSVKDLEGKKIGINGTGSLSDLLAQWALKGASITANLIPLGGGGVLPNLRGGNVDAILLFAPLSYQLLDTGEVRSLIDYSKEMPASAVDTWTASPAFAEKGPLLERTLRALYAGVEVLRNDRDYAIKLIARNGEISESLATLEYERTFLNLPVSNDMDADLVARYLQFAELIGLKDLPKADSIMLGAIKAK